MRGVLRSGRCRMLEGVPCLGDVSRHGDIEETFVVVPVQVEAKVRGAGPVGGVGITSGKGGE